MIILSKNGLWNCAVCASIEIVVTTLSSLRTEPSLGFLPKFLSQSSDPQEFLLAPALLVSLKL